MGSAAAATGVVITGLRSGAAAPDGSLVSDAVVAAAAAEESCAAAAAAGSWCPHRSLGFKGLDLVRV